MSKRCTKCGEEKPLEEFYPRAAKCKPCYRADVRRNRLANADYYREYDRNRARSPERLADRLARNRQFQSDCPEKRRAHIAANNALRDGRIVKTPCAFCGADDNLEAHHHDYSKPLDVTWLCRPCHRRFHALERMATYERDEAA